MIGRQHDNRRSVLEPAELIAFADADIAGEYDGPSGFRIEHAVEKMQPDTGNQYSRDRHQRQDFAAFEAGPNNRALIFTKKPFNSLQGDRIYIPGIATDESDLFDPAVVGLTRLALTETS